MLARGIKRSLLEHPAQLLPTFLLPFRARITTLNNASNSVPTCATFLRAMKQSRNLRTKPLVARNTQLLHSKSAAAQSSAYSTQSAPSLSTTSQSASQAQESLPESVTALLPLLQAQKPHYITAHIHGRPYLVTAGDTIRLPFLMHGVSPGDVLRLNCATHLGSRDFTLKAPPPAKGTQEGPGKVSYLDDRLFVCRAVVMGVESEPMRIMEKTKRRQRHIKTVKSKHRYTVLKIKELEVKGLEDVQQGSLEGITAEVSAAA